MLEEIVIKPIASLRDNYIWAIIDKEQKKVCLVDPGTILPVETFLNQEQLKLQAILLTHHHADHSKGAETLRKRHQVPIYAASSSPYAHVHIPLQDGDQVPISSSLLNLTVLAIPGHTLDHLAYYAPGFLFCGDTLFSAGCGRLFEGTAEQLYNSLQKMAVLPEDTKIYCGHEYTIDNLRFAKLAEPSNLSILKRLEKVQLLRQKNLPSLPSSLREELDTNPFLRCSSPELIASVEQYSGQKLSNPLEVFRWLRAWKDQFN